MFYFFITKWRRKIRRGKILQNTQRETPIHFLTSGMILMES